MRQRNIELVKKEEVEDLNLELREMQDMLDMRASDCDELRNELNKLKIINTYFKVLRYRLFRENKTLIEVMIYQSLLDQKADLYSFSYLVYGGRRESGENKGTDMIVHRDIITGYYDLDGIKTMFNSSIEQMKMIHKDIKELVEYRVDRI